MKKDVIHSTDYRLSFGKQPLIGFQMLFVAFGALVLVPLLTGLALLPNPLI